MNPPVPPRTPLPHHTPSRARAQAPLQGSPVPSLPCSLPYLLPLIPARPPSPPHPSPVPADRNLGGHIGGGWGGRSSGPAKPGWRVDHYPNPEPSSVPSPGPGSLRCPVCLSRDDCKSATELTCPASSTHCYRGSIQFRGGEPGRRSPGARDAGRGAEPGGGGA